MDPVKVFAVGSVTSDQVNPPAALVLHFKKNPFCGELLTFKLASSMTSSSTVAESCRLSEPLNDCTFAVISPVILKFLVVSKVVAVAALPVVFWLPSMFTPGKFIFDDPLKFTPPIDLVVSRIVAVAALPDVSWLPAWCL